MSELPNNEIQPANLDLSKAISILRNEWMANKIEYDDTEFIKAIFKIAKELPENPSVEDIAEQTYKTVKELLSSLDPDLEKAYEKLAENKKPLLERFKNRDTPKIGEYFKEDSYANVCQQNVILLAAVANLYGYDVQVAPFTYIGKQSGRKLIHAVAVYQDNSGETFILDPTLRVPAYGDVTYLPKEEYLSKFTEPFLGDCVKIFSSP